MTVMENENMNNERKKIAEIDRYIKTLKESLEKAEDKREAIYIGMVNSCNHDFVDTNFVWDSSVGMGVSKSIKMVKQECKHCGTIRWSKLND